jgi:hypothetical protein
VQSTTSTTTKEHDEVETSTRQKGETQSWPKNLILEYNKPTEIGAQSLQLIQGFLTPTKYL